MAGGSAMDDDSQLSPVQRDPQTYAALGAAMEVHRVLGFGFLENVYKQAMAIEFRLRSIPCEIEPTISIRYKHSTLGAVFRPDFVCYGSVIVEVKALGALTMAHRAQTINYLKASTLERALLLNFGSSRLEFRRLICSAAGRETGGTTTTNPNGAD
jgi:GxxExxY protein